MLQYRNNHAACQWRFFNWDNSTNIHQPWGYKPEQLLHELFLQSEHRTLDPEEADFFYVPVYHSCYMWPIHGEGSQGE